jgi:hypothetical protein
VKKLLLLLIIMPITSLARQPGYPVWLYGDYLWQKEQAMHIQTQQQLLNQDLYRRQLLLQDQQWQIQRQRDEQMNNLQQNSIMYEHADRLRMFSNQPNASPNAVKKKSGR